MSVVWIGGEPESDEERLEAIRMIVEQTCHLLHLESARD